MNEKDFLKVPKEQPEQDDRVFDIVERDLFTVEWDAPVVDVVKAMAERRIGTALINDKNGKIVGIFSERDLLTKFVPRMMSMRRTKVNQIMSSPLITVPLNIRAAPALKVMFEKNIRHLLVTNESGKIVGMIGMRKLLEFIVKSLAVSNKLLRDRLGPLEEVAELKLK